MHKTLAHMAVCILVGLVLQACTPEEKPRPVSLSDDTPKSRGALKMVGAKEVVYKGKGNYSALQLLVDRQFTDTTPKEWQEAKGEFPQEWSLAGAASATLVEEPVGLEAPVAVELVAAEQPLVLAQTTADLSGSHHTPAFMATAWAKTDVVNGAALVITYYDQESPRQLVAIHPGDGNWHELVIHGSLVSAPTTFKFTLTSGPKVRNQRVSLGPTSLRLAAEAPAPSANLLADANFDRLGFSGAKGTGAWFPRAWGGNTIRDVEMVPTPDRPEGSYAVSFPAFEQGGLALVQKDIALDDSHRGKEIVAEAWAKSDVENGLQLLVEATYPDGTIDKERAIVTEPGEWQQLQISYQLPESGALPTIALSLVRRGGEDSGLALMDDVFVGIDGEAAEAP